MEATAAGRPICDPTNPTYHRMCVKFGEAESTKILVDFLAATERRLEKYLEELRELTDQPLKNAWQEWRLKSKIRRVVRRLKEREDLFASPDQLLSTIFADVPWEPSGPFADIVSKSGR